VCKKRTEKISRDQVQKISLPLPCFFALLFSSGLLIFFTKILHQLFSLLSCFSSHNLLPLKVYSAGNNQPTYYYVINNNANDFKRQVNIEAYSIILIYSIAYLCNEPHHTSKVSNALYNIVLQEAEIYCLAMHNNTCLQSAYSGILK
jgi:hypothetical protein